jgi:hypothetical protein
LAEPGFSREKAWVWSKNNRIFMFGLLTFANTDPYRFRPSGAGAVFDSAAST